MSTVPSYGDVATVDMNGLLTARQHGKTAVSVYSGADSDMTDGCSVTVLEDENSLEIHPEIAYLGKDESQQFTVTTHAGVPIKVTFNKIHNEAFFLTDDGLVTATADAGKGDITAVDSLGRKVTATIRCVNKDEPITLSNFCSMSIPGESGEILVNHKYPDNRVYTFTSNNPSVIYFLNDQVAMYQCGHAGKARVTVKSNFDDSQATIDLTVRKEGIYLNDDYERVFWGQSFKLIAYDGVTGKPVPCTFTSSIPQIASVGKTSGVVTARGIYSDPEKIDTYDRVTIYARDSRGRQAQATIIVIYPPIGIVLSVDEGDPMMRVGDTLTLKADVDVPELHTVMDFDIQYTSSDPTVAKVDKEGNVTAVGAGSAVISASMYNGVWDSLLVTVGTSDPVWVHITCGNVELGRGERLSMDRYPPEFNPGASSAYAYYSSDRTVLTAGGRMLQAVGLGTVTLTIRTFNDMRDSVTVTVKNPPTQINVSSELLQLTPGDKKDLTIALPEGEAGTLSVKAVGDDCVTFSEVSDDTVGVTGKKLGSLILTFKTYNGVTKSVRIDVLPGPSSVSLATKSLRLAMGDSYTFIPIFKGTPTSCTFSSSNENVATVTDDGVVTLVAPGRTSITINTVNGKKASCALTVYQKVISIDLSQNRAALSPGMTLRLIPAVLPVTASNKAVTWTSSNSAVMKADKNGIVTISKSASPGSTAIITAATIDGSGISGTIEITVLPSAQQVVLKQDETELGDSLTVNLEKITALSLTANALPLEAAQDVAWSTSDKKIASVDQNGDVRFMKVGSVDITATAKGGSGVKKSLRIRITRLVDAITVEGPDGLIPGSSAQLSAVVTPATASKKAVVWISSDPAIMTIDNKGVVTISKTAEPGALATITATATDGSGVSGSFLVNVTEPVTEIEVTTETDDAHVNYKASLQLNSAVSPDTASSAVTWKSSNTKYVTVDDNGKVYGKKVGKATVYATAADGTGVRGQITIQVITPVTGVKLPEAGRIFIGQTKKMAATLSPSGPTIKTLTWASGNESVATVDEATGLVTAVAAGEAVITATAHNGLSDSCTVTVTQPVTKIDVSADSPVLYKGETTQIDPVVSPSDANDKGLTWKSSKTKYATVDAQGFVTGKSAGKVKITATAKDGSGISGSVMLTVASPEKSIKLSRTGAVLYHNGGTDALKSLKLTAATSPKGSAFKALTWSIESGDTVAAVGQNGVVTALAEGVAVIRATSDNDHNADCAITVRTLPTSFELTTKEKTLVFKQGFNLGAEATFDTECTEPALTWSTDNKKVATVSSTGVVKASKNKTGKAIITATTKNGIKATCVVTVIKSLPKAKSGTVDAKSTLPIITLRLSGGGYATSDARAADVAENGTVTPGGDGKAFLEAGGKQITVKVSNSNLTELTLDEGVELTLVSDTDIRWTPKNDRIATVDKDGSLTALREGETMVTGETSDGRTVEIRIIVRCETAQGETPTQAADLEPAVSQPSPAPEPEPSADPEPSTEPSVSEEPASSGQPSPSDSRQSECPSASEDRESEPQPEKESDQKADTRSTPTSEITNAEESNQGSD